MDVVVVGAGMAGITAARDLSASGLQVVLVEARNRVGGRTYTGEAFGGAIELGGGYVHWTQPNVWHELQRHGLSALSPPLSSSKLYWKADGKIHTGTEQDWFEAVAPLLQRFFADARAQFPMPASNADMVDNAGMDALTIKDKMDSLGLSPYETDCIEGAFSGMMSSSSDHGVAQFTHGAATYFGDYLALLDTAGQWSLAGGTRALAEAMLAQCDMLKVQLGMPVAAIRDDGDAVTVTTREGVEMRARAVVVAVPLNTVQDMAITPQLPPAVRRMISQRNPTRAAKVWARVKGHVEPFTAFAPPGACHLSTVRAEKLCGQDTLFLCMCADAAAIPSDAEERRRVVQDALRTYVADIEVVDTAMHDWVADEFAQGAWMVHRPGSLTGAARQMRQPHGRMYFAGSDIAAVDTGSIEGAMGSGAAAARAVVAKLRAEDRPCGK